jgi:glutamine synthetase
VKYISELSSTNASLAGIGIGLDKDSLESLVSLSNSMMSSVATLSEAIDKHDFDSVEEHMTFCAKTICPLMLEVRESADALEGLVADEYWPLPKYQEMLFIK